MAEEVVRRAVEPVGARFGHHVHDRAARLPELGREEIRLHLEFLNRIDRGRVLQVGDAGVLLDRHDGHAVEQDVRRGIPRAVRDEVGVRIPGPPAGSDDARREVGEGHRIAPEVGQRDERLVVDDLAQVRDGRVHARRRGADLDALVHLADVQSRVDGGLLLDGEREPAARELLEAVSLDRQHVLARLQRRNAEPAFAVGRRRMTRASVGIGDGDRGVRNGGAGRVGCRAADSRREGLSEGQGGRQCDERQASKDRCGHAP